MCCMLSLVAPDELGISKTRSIRFLDAYIGALKPLSLKCWKSQECSDLLTRLRLHTCAAYLRKFCEMEDVRNKTLVCIIRIFIPDLVIYILPCSWKPPSTRRAENVDDH